MVRKEKQLEIGSILGSNCRSEKDGIKFAYRSPVGGCKVFFENIFSWNSPDFTVILCKLNRFADFAICYNKNLLWLKGICDLRQKKRKQY